MIKNFTKLMLTAALLFGAVGGVKATKKYASISVATGATWNSETNTMGFEAVNGWQILLTGFPAGNITAYTNIHATLSNMSDNINNIRLRIKDTSDKYADYNLEEGENTVNLATLSENYPDCNFESIADITLWSPTSAADNKTVGSGDDAASVTITNFYIEKPFVFAFDATGTAVVDVTDLIVTGCYSLNQQTGVLTNSYDEETNKDGNVQIVFPSAVDMSSVYGFKVNYTGTMVLGGIWLNNYGFKFGNSVAGRTDIASHMTSETTVNKWRWEASTTTGDMTISSVEFYSSVMSANPGEETTMSNLSNYHKNGDNYENTGYTPSYRVNESTGAAYFGVDWNGENCQNYSDVEGYKAIRVYQAGDNTPRAFFFNSTADGQQVFNFTWNEKGYYELLLSTVYFTVNNYKLISVRPASGTTSTITGICMVVDNPIYDYVLSGNGVLTASVTAALADETATSINATGLTNTSAIELTSANPNCLFEANAGKLSNTKNVIVSGTCANLVLTDGYPFKAPADFTATSASYTTTINETAKAGTLCLPFAAEIPSGVTAYKLTYTSGDNATAEAVETTIPANKPVLLNGSGSVTFTGSGAAVDADATNQYGAMTGVFERTQVPENSYVLQYDATEGLGFYKVTTTDIYANPFRAYLTAGQDASRLNIIFVDDETTGIADVRSSKEEVRGEYFNLKGQRVAQPTKGLYIKNGKKYIVK